MVKKGEKQQRDDKMNYFLPLVLITLFCSGCASPRGPEDLLQEITRTASIVQVQPWPEVSNPGPEVFLNVGVVTSDPEEVKWVVNEFSNSSIWLDKGPWRGNMGYVVFLDKKGNPLAWARLEEGGRDFTIEPCVKTWKGYIVKYIWLEEDVPPETVVSAEAWRYLYKHLPVIDPFEFVLQRDTYKDVGLDPDWMMFGSRSNRVLCCSSNLVMACERISPSTFHVKEKNSKNNPNKTHSKVIELPK